MMHLLKVLAGTPALYTPRVKQAAPYHAHQSQAVPQVSAGAGLAWKSAVAVVWGSARVAAWALAPAYGAEWEKERAGVAARRFQEGA